MRKINYTLFLSFLILDIIYVIFTNGKDWICSENVEKVFSPLGETVRGDFIQNELVRKSGKSAKQIAEQTRKIVAVHEAGHAVMSYLNEIENFHVLISCFSPKVITVCKPVDAEDMKKNILVKYAGAAAEELLFGQFTAGCMGNENGDFETATNYIKEYILMTDPSVSKSLLDEEITDKVVALSKEFYDLSQKILSDHKEMLEALSEYLISKDSVSAEEIKNLFENKGLAPKSLTPERKADYER